MIKNGRPYTNEGQRVDDSLIDRLDAQEKSIVLKWIADNICPRKTPLTSYTSYGIKHILQSDTGIYLTNNEFKDAMLISGYKPINANELNWCYCISKRSPAFDYKSREKIRERELHKSINIVSTNDISSNNGVVGNAIESTIDNSITTEHNKLYDDQIALLIMIYNELSPLKRAKLLIYADDLKNNKY